MDSYSVFTLVVVPAILFVGVFVMGELSKTSLYDENRKLTRNGVLFRICFSLLLFVTLITGILNYIHKDDVSAPIVKELEKIGYSYDLTNKTLKKLKAFKEPFLHVYPADIKIQKNPNDTILFYVGVKNDGDAPADSVNLKATFYYRKNGQLKGGYRAGIAKKNSLAVGATDILRGFLAGSQVDLNADTQYIYVKGVYYDRIKANKYDIETILSKTSYDPVWSKTTDNINFYEATR